MILSKLANGLSSSIERNQIKTSHHYNSERQRDREDEFERKQGEHIREFGGEKEGEFYLIK